MPKKNNISSHVALTLRRSRPAGSRFGTTVARSCKVQDKVKILE
jgi:hypothetical protein